jgi:DNA-directed RNA polymerase alpha subunit
MSEHTTTTTNLATLAEQNVNGDWWKEGALEQPNKLMLPTRVLHILDNAGITTVEQLKAAGPVALSKLEGLGKGGFQQIVELLRALDHRSNGGDA